MSRPKSAKKQAANRVRFLRQTDKRTNDCLWRMRTIENLANRGEYTYEPQELDQIVAALEGGLKKIKSRYALAKKGVPTVSKFSLKSAPKDEGY